MPSILEQLGIDTKLSAPAGGETGLSPEGQPQGAMPVTEAAQPSKLSSSKEMADMIVAGAIAALDQVVAVYGYTTEEGKKIARAIDNLSAVVPESKVKEVQGQLSSMLSGGGAPMGMPGMPSSVVPGGAQIGSVPKP